MVVLPWEAKPLQATADPSCVLDSVFGWWSWPWFLQYFQDELNCTRRLGWLRVTGFYYNELDCVPKQRFVSQSISHTKFLGVTLWSLPVFLQFFCSLLTPHTPFLEELHKDTYKAGLQHCKMYFSDFIPQASSHLCYPVGGSQTGWPGVELPLLCFWPSALHLGVCLRVHCTWVYVWVHCTWVCVSECIALGCVHCLAFSGVSMTSAEGGEVGARGLGDHRGSQRLWTHWVAVCLLMSPIKHKDQSRVPSGFLSWPHLAESPLGPFCIRSANLATQIHYVRVCDS